MSKTPYLMGDTMVMKRFKPKDHTRRKANKGFTFMASVFSFFICTSIFYLLNHSPDNLTSLLNNNMFWFFMSNALILILAADYEAFSSHSNKTHQDHYEEYVKHSQASRNYYVTTPSSYGVVPTSKYEQVDEKPCVSVLDDHVPPKQELFQEKMKKKKEITVAEHHEIELVPERVLEIVPQNDTKKSASSSSLSSKKKPVQDDTSDIRACEESTLLYDAGRAVGRRSKSDRYGHVKKRVVIDEGKKRVTRRADTMKVEEARVEEENNNNNEFSSMSNEELNRRVEEFIQRFNRQIRLQAVRNTVVLEA
ncbi:hypothetical protein QN277_020491 [Acacia crassicarpa]|uniref:Uncharacterized protein n=1 Tax=Acacia crassicarpa TaxID=499986 RepID=A0AAE1JN28_9FABA|nr:hypothetical protein QN277_020491 [Acacia crassicarpa]